MQDIDRPADPSAPAPAASLDPWVRALLPVLLHELNNQTQLLVGLRAVLEMGDADELFVARADDIVRAGERTRELGYALAVLGSAQGADLLMTRRDRRGVAHLLELVTAAARRDRRALTLSPREAPDLAPAALDGWQVPWACAAFAWAAQGAPDAAPATLAWVRSGEERVGLRAAPWSGDEAAFADVLDALPGAALERDGAARVLSLPASWFEL